VRLNVVLHGVLGVFRGLNMMAVRHVGMVGGGFVFALFVMGRGFVVVARSVFQMLRCLLVMMSCFL
jgi:hypothetical protein